MTKAGVLRSSNGLEPTSAATTVRVPNGKTADQGQRRLPQAPVREEPCGRWSLSRQCRWMVTLPTLNGDMSWAHKQDAASERPPWELQLGAVLAAELRRLGLTFVPGFFNDRRDLGVGEEVLPARLIPVEEHPDPVGLIGIAKHGRTLGPVLLSLLSALG